jgi:hypothetical protein
LEWIALLIEDLDFLDTAVFVKQLGARPTFNRQPIQLKDKKGGDMREWLKEFQRREFPDVKVAA